MNTLHPTLIRVSDPRTNFTPLTVGLALLATLVTSCGRDEVESELAPLSAPPASNSISADRESVSAVESDAFRPVSVEPGLSQGITVGPVGPQHRPRALLLRNLVRDPATGQWTPHVWSFSTSYDIHAICGRVKGEFFLLGRLADGSNVLERWQAVESEESATPNTSPPEVLRTELYRGTALAGASALAADPEGRFLLVMRETPRTVTRVALQSPPSITDELTLSSEPALATLDNAVFLRLQHVGLGRVWVISGTGNDSIVLVDSTNDSVFEQHYLLDPSTWTAMGFDDAVWTDDFVNRVWYR